MRWFVRSALTASLAFVSCGAGSKVRENVLFPADHPIEAAETNPVIIITLDGVRWQDVFGPNGPVTMPNLYRGVGNGGAILGAPGHGSPISSSGPNFVSLPGYTELFEGRTNTGCGSNFCNGSTVPTIVDEIRSQHPDPTDVAVFSSWERIEFAATLEPERIVVSSGSIRAQGDERALLENTETRQAYVAGRGVSNWPGHADYRPDRYTARLALAYLHERHPAFLFVGLGDTDEYAHKGSLTGYMQALRDGDAFVGHVLDELSHMGERGRRTLVLVTADHGRANDFRDHGGKFPESARTWLFAIGPIATRGYISAPVPRHLADIAPTIRTFVGLPANSVSNGSIMQELITR